MDLAGHCWHGIPLIVISTQQLSQPIQAVSGKGLLALLFSAAVLGAWSPCWSLWNPLVNSICYVQGLCLTTRSSHSTTRRMLCCVRRRRWRWPDGDGGELSVGHLVPNGSPNQCKASTQWTMYYSYLWRHLTIWGFVQNWAMGLIEGSLTTCFFQMAKPSHTHSQQAVNLEVIGEVTTSLQLLPGWGRPEFNILCPWAVQDPGMLLSCSEAQEKFLSLFLAFLALSYQKVFMIAEGNFHWLLRVQTNCNVRIYCKILFNPTESCWGHGRPFLLGDIVIWEPCLWSE